MIDIHHHCPHLLWTKEVWNKANCDINQPIWIFFPFFYACFTFYQDSAFLKFHQGKHSGQNAPKIDKYFCFASFYRMSRQGSLRRDRDSFHSFSLTLCLQTIYFLLRFQTLTVALDKGFSFFSWHYVHLKFSLPAGNLSSVSHSRQLGDGGIMHLATETPE